MKRITTDDPNSNVESLHNQVLIKDGWAYLRFMGINGDPIDICDYVRKHMPDMQEYDNETLVDLMCDDWGDDFVPLIYSLAVGFAEVRQKLKAYEDAAPLETVQEWAKRSDKKTAPKRFQKPTVDEVRAYCIERKNHVDPECFVDHYEANGWKVGGRASMKDWRASVRTWEKSGYSNAGGDRKKCTTYKSSSYDLDKIEADLNSGLL